MRACVPLLVVHTSTTHLLLSPTCPQPQLSHLAAAVEVGSLPAAALPAPPAGLDLAASSPLAPRAAWVRVWTPWLKSIASLTTASRGAVRDVAVVALQRALLHPDVRGEPPAVWGAAFECVVFPLLASLLQRAVSRELDDERLMLRAVSNRQ